MNSNSNQKYLELKENLINALQSDEFYELFNNSIKSGKNNFSLYQKYMNNIIDPSWVKAIEDCIIPIDNIIRNPMRFIKQEEEIVNIEQAKKISQESIRHLAQNTNMIQKIDKNGMVTPNKILNILKEETFATYENRFLYTLLKHLQYFIDKRLRILNDSKVQAENKVSLESEFNIGKEKIKYEFSLSSTEKTEKNIKKFKLDEDTSQMDLMQRIERLRMILFDFQNSQLIKSLNGCLQVRPPIMRTNVILKNPNFKKVLELWTFIESYNDVGLSIQILENQEMPNDDYIEEMFNVTLINYYLFNKHVKPEKELEKAQGSYKEYKPNLVHKTVEEFINEFEMDIDDIERIFVDKVKKATQKRKENELKIKKAIDRVLSKERARKRKLLEQERRRQEMERLRALKEEQRKQRTLQAMEERAKRKALMEEERAKKQALLALEKQRREEEKARQLEEKAKALKAKQDMLDKIKYNFNSLKGIIIGKYPKAKIKDLNDNEFEVYLSIGILMSVSNKINECRITLQLKEEFVTKFNEKHGEIASLDKTQKSNTWYKVVDKGTLSDDDLQELVVHSFEYDRELRFEKAQITRAKTKLLKDKKLNDEMMNEIIEFIREYVLTNLKYGKFKGNENSYKILRRNVLMVSLQKKGYFIRFDFPARKHFANDLFARFPNHIEKLNSKKDWFRIVLNGEFTKDDLIEIINHSYSYLTNAEAKFIAKNPEHPDSLKIIKSNMLEELKAKKLALREEERLRKIAAKEEEQARKLALKEEEQARKLALKEEKLLKLQEAKEQALRIKEEYLAKIRNNFESIKTIIHDKYPKAKIKCMNDDQFSVHQSIGALLVAQFRVNEYKIIFKAKEEFVSEFNQKYPDMISLDKSQKDNNWYKFVDKDTIKYDDLVNLINHTFEYDKELRFEKSQVTRAKTRQLKEHKLNDEMMDQIINQVKDHVLNNLKYVSVKERDNDLKILRKRIVMVTLQKKGYFIRLDFPTKRTFVKKMSEKFPNHIEKLGKRKDWYRLIVTGHMTIADVLMVINNSYKYLVSLESKASESKSILEHTNDLYDVVSDVISSNDNSNDVILQEPIENKTFTNVASVNSNDLFEVINDVLNNNDKNNEIIEPEIILKNDENDNQ